jgi:hypothetical protein
MTLLIPQGHQVRLRQRADYTQKYNHSSGRHGWLRLTPAYSVKVVDELLAPFRGTSQRVLDPFCGTATTALCSISQGHIATTLEINPFLVWLASTKTAIYSEETKIATREYGRQALEASISIKARRMAEPPIFNIERWWCHSARSFLCCLRPAIDDATPPNSPERSLLLLAFCRVLIALSNAAFNHQSMSFRGEVTNREFTTDDLIGRFFSDLEHILEALDSNPLAPASIIQLDARSVDQLKDRFDLVITSPPYANRMSYIRELRPYMYWLGFLESGREAGELDWKAIGGTWGIATSRLSEWVPSESSFSPKWLPDTLDAVSNEDNANGRLLAAYVNKYAQDMWLHFSSLTKVLNLGSKIHYIVGNSSFYGTLFSTERLYADFLSELGYHDVMVRAIRKRNSKRELVEFDVSAQWR